MTHDTLNGIKIHNENIPSFPFSALRFGFIVNANRRTENGVGMGIRLLIIHSSLRCSSPYTNTQEAESSSSEVTVIDHGQQQSQVRAGGGE